MKHKTYLISGVCIAALAFCVALSAQTMPRKKSSPSPAASPTAKASASPSKAERAIPFKGMIASVDSKAKTFTIAGKEKSRTFKITDKTMITKAGNPATMKDVVANEEVRGSYWKIPDGSLEAKTIKLGPLTEAEKAAQEARKAKREEKKEAASTSPTASPEASASPKP